jgi:hypothetical protein
MNYSFKHYYELLKCQSLPDSFVLIDHLGGFDKKGYNNILHNINADAQQKNKVYNITYHQVLDKSIVDKYQSLNIEFSAKNQVDLNLNKFCNYNVHPALKYKNFICSFNGSPHVSRKLLVSILEKFGYYDSKYCSKNFSYSTDALDGHINDYVPDQLSLYRKFFISADSEDFFQTVNSFGHVQYEHDKNIYNLENKLTDSFLHIVSETMATSYVPFVTEKFLYSIVTRGLFLSYAQPGWHAHIEKYYGFKLYTKLFDYRFDSIDNPVERLVELVTMISKFSCMSTDEWRDLYEMEQDTIKYNYDHHASGDYIRDLKKYEN